ncbi:MAG: hypothetical protein C0504_17035, partial [Candidatus Solibacter sp.]|nr:hypothetical protein [Candidatus Solibacter sp.]
MHDSAIARHIAADFRYFIVLSIENSSTGAGFGSGLGAAGNFAACFAKGVAGGCTPAGPGACFAGGCTPAVFGASGDAIRPCPGLLFRCDPGGGNCCIFGSPSPLLKYINYAPNASLFSPNSSPTLSPPQLASLNR